MGLAVYVPVAPGVVVAEKPGSDKDEHASMLIRTTIAGYISECDLIEIHPCFVFVEFFVSFFIIIPKSCNYDH